MVKFIDNFKKWITYRRVQRAIKEADRQQVITGKKQLVMMYDGKPIVVSKQHLKRTIKLGAYCKGFTPEKAESLAIYKTR